MSIDVGITDEGVKIYPPHKHKNFEIMTYLKGTGYLYTPECNYPFEPGTAIIVPAGVIHGSVSDFGFVNVSISGEFERLLPYGNSVIPYNSDNSSTIDFANIIFENRYSDTDILTNLCNAYIMLLTKNIQFGDAMNAAIRKIIDEINTHAFDSDINLNKILNNAGYAEDYIRAQFKKFTGKTPISFLTGIRVSRACFLINVFGKKMTLQEIAYRCGYCDYTYFSKRFKSICGVSPKEYLHRVSL